MIENTENNHLLYWYNDDKNVKWRTNELDSTSMSVGGTARKPMSLKAELIRNARSLNRRFNDLTIFMSGGLDSEIALRSFLEAGLTPKLVTVRFPNDNNMHDIGPMMKMLNSMNLPYTVIDFDPEEFYQSGEWKDIAMKYQAYTFYQQMLLKIAEKYSAPMITIDEVELELLPNINWETGEHKFEWCFLKKEDQDGVWRRFNDLTGIPALNNFYTYSPESILAFLKQETVADLIRNKIPGKLAWTSSKMKIYGSLGYNFRRRPKWHGVENYIHLWDSVRYNIANSGLCFKQRNYAVSASELERNLESGKETLCQVA
jgi:hypothetical protein